MTTYLVTGAGGYLGTTLVRHVEQAGGTVRRLARADLARPAAIEPALDGVDVVFHLAAQTSVYVAESDPVADVAANVLPMVNLLEACRARGARVKVVFASSASVYGLGDQSQPADPVTVYDLHKLVAERYLRLYAGRGVVSGASLRLANVYGPGPAGRPDRGIINGMVRRALAGETLKIYGTGEFERDYIYVDDVARAFLLAADRADELGGGSFVVGTGVGHTVAAAIRLVARLVAVRSGRAVQVEHVDPPAAQSPIELRNFVAHTEPLRQATGFASSVTLEQGLVRTIESLA